MTFNLECSIKNEIKYCSYGVKGCVIPKILNELVMDSGSPALQALPNASDTIHLESGMVAIRSRIVKT